MVLIDIDVGQRVMLWYRENDRVKYVFDDFIPEILIAGEREKFENLYIENIQGIVYVKNKRIKTVDDELDGIAIGVRPEKFFSISSMLNRYFNFYTVKIFNADIRLSVRYLAEKSLFPFFNGEERFSIPDISEIKTLFIEKKNNILKIGSKELSLQNYYAIENEIMENDPDIIVFNGADDILPMLYEKARKNGDYFNIGRHRGWTELKSREYFSYGREFYKERSILPKGRILIDPETSFIYREGGLEGVIMASRISALPASYAARATPGTLVSTLEVYEALKKNIAIPYHKYNAEKEKTLEQLILADRGGIVYQPHPGIYWNVKEFDFTSMYPSIIVRKNLSIETLNRKCEKSMDVPELNYKICLDKEGFLASALRQLLYFRMKLKKLKKFDEKFSGIDNALKWMLVTSFGYTGYRNAKFGSIEIHESINAFAREYLLIAKEILEKNNFEIIHGIVDSLWVKGTGDTQSVIDEIERKTSLNIDLSDSYLWMKILPEKDEDIGSPGKYIALNEKGDFKVRGIMLRRSDSPEFIKNFQKESLEILRKMRKLEDMENVRKEIMNLFTCYKERIEMRRISKLDLLIEKRVNKYPWEYSAKTAEYHLLKNFYERGELKRPGESIKYLVYSINPIRAVDESRIDNVDYSVPFYLKYLRDALDEIKP